MGAVAPVDPTLPGLEMMGGMVRKSLEGPARSDGRFVADITIPAGFKMAAGQPFSKTWLVRNDGETAWTADCRLVQVGGDEMGETAGFAVPELAPGEQGFVTIALAAPAGAGNHTGDWQLADGQGNRFGDILVVRIATARAVRMVGQAAAEFLADVTIAEGATLAPGEQFVKVWRVKNSGLRPWAVGSRLAFKDGNAMNAGLSHPILLADPGQEVEVAIPMTAPADHGMFMGIWQFQDEQGATFGDELAVKVVVADQ
jgi:hypothetical protein